MSMTDDDDLDTDAPVQKPIDLGELTEGPDPEEDELVEHTDGSVTVLMEDEKPNLDPDGEHYANLAEKMEEHELVKLGMELCELVEEDKQAREERDKMYEEGIRRTGLANDAPGGAQFQGASRVVHPGLIEACIDFQARAIKELFPPGGPVKDEIIGEVSRPKVEKARRKTEYMNWQLRRQIPDFRTTLEQFLIQLPLGGSQYLKGPVHDKKTNKPRYFFVGINDVYLPYAAMSYYSAQRRTERYQLTDLDVKTKMASGEWRDVDLMSVPVVPDVSNTARAEQKVEGVDETSENVDDLREFYEIDTYLDLEGQGMLPYVVTVESSSHTVVSIYRNWDEDDETQERVNRLETCPLIPWSGPYGLGFPQIIGGLSAAATGALRALLDSAHIANAPTALKLKGNNVSGQSPSIQIGQVTEIEGGAASLDPDIRKLAMPMPFNGPNPVLFQLLGFLVDATKGVVRTTLDDVGEHGANTPVGTTLARVQEGLVVFSAIHQRLHDFMSRVLEGLHRYNRLHLDDEQTIDELGELVVKRRDFQGPRDVVPVSDPNIFSDLQRTAQLQMVSARAQALAPMGIYDIRRVEERFLEQSKIPAWKELLLPKPEPSEMNAVNENAAMTAGRPAVAFPEQDHLAHLQTHLTYLQSPIFGASPFLAPRLAGPMLQHVLEHLTLWYATTVYEQASVAGQAAGIDIDEVQKSKDVGEKKSLDRLLAATSGGVLEKAPEIFSKIPPIVQQAMQMLQSMAPPQPIDPSIVGKMDVERRMKDDQASAQLKAQELQLRGQELQQKTIETQVELERLKNEGQQAHQRELFELQLKASKLQSDLQAAEKERELEGLRMSAEHQKHVEKLQAEHEKALLHAEVKTSTNREDNLTAVELTQAKIDAGGSGGGLSNGTGLGEGPNPRPVP